MKLDFNQNWIFFDGEKQCEVTLPHDAMLHEKRYASCRSDVHCAYFKGGKYRYEKTFEIAAEMLGKSLVLLFEGVYQCATVTVNGKKAAFHRYGYTEFEVDISSFVIAGQNTISVEVDNSLVPNCRWYTGAGIYRPVWLLVREKEHIKDVFVKTISTSPAVVEVVATATKQMPLFCEIWDGESLVAKGGLGQFRIENAHLWTTETPHLYTAKVKAANDEVTATFGIRKLEWTAQTGLTVNGQTVKLRGGCIHHDNGVIGACSFREAEFRRVQILKEQGFNALRMAHNPASRYLLEACDALGMYVMEEFFDGWYIPKTHHDFSRHFFETYKQEITSTVLRDFNHPSVILYSVGNEVSETATRRGVELCAELRDIVKEVDNTRPVTVGVNVLIDVYSQMGIGIYKDKGNYTETPLSEGKGYKEKQHGSAFFNAMANKLGALFFLMSKGRRAEKICKSIAPSVDILGLNYASSRYDKDIAKYPERLMVGSETMVADLPYNWERVLKYPQLIGDFVWSAWDYLGEACIGDWTYHSYKGLPLLAGQGMIDITGKPLAAMHFMQVVWGRRKEPFICVRPLNHAGETPSTGAWQFTNAIDSWSWTGYEGKIATVEVFSQGEYVELYLADKLGKRKLVGKKKLKNFKTIFNIKYKNGTLNAFAYDKNGKLLATHSLTTAGAETQITVKANKQQVKKGELVFVEIETTDTLGNLKPYIEDVVNVRASNIKLLGLGSALCKTDESFVTNHHKLYRGRAFAVLQATDTGIADAAVSCDGMETATIQIEVTE